VPAPDTPSLNRVALTTHNVLKVCLSLSTGVVGVLASTLWWRGRWTFAVCLTVLFYLAQVALIQLR